jgi:YhcG PDDEXK nuclease domain/DUF1016 N-terminal domain
MRLSDQKKIRIGTNAPISYKLLISSIAEVHARTQAGAAGAVNRYLTLRNWFIGAYIVEFEQNGEDRASYGQELLPRLARDLKKRSIPGCSPEMLGRMRVFRVYPRLNENGSSPFAAGSRTFSASTEPTEIPSPAVTESNTALPTPLDGRTLLRLSWSHLIELIRLEDSWKRAFYENECLKGQMNFYLNYWKREVTSPEDNPPVGLLLCSDKDQTKVEYAIGGLDHRLFVSRYLVALPKPNEIEQLIERDRALWERRGETKTPQYCGPPDDK